MRAALAGGSIALSDAPRRTTRRTLSDSTLFHLARQRPSSNYAICLSVSTRRVFHFSLASFAICSYYVRIRRRTNRNTSNVEELPAQCSEPAPEKPPAHPPARRGEAPGGMRHEQSDGRDPSGFS
jgi:hypothetical protein